jgi:hypothetical protein
MPSTQVANNSGPEAIFTELLKVKVRPDQSASLRRIAGVMGITRSDLVRLIIDNTVSKLDDAIEPMHAYIEEHTHAAQ